MTTTIRFTGHEVFHRIAIRLAVSAALAALALHVLALLEPRLGGLAGPVPLAALAGAAVWNAVPAEIRARARDLSLVVLAAAAAALALAAVQRGALGGVTGAAIYAGALGLAMARGLVGRRFWLAGVVGAAAVLGAPSVVENLLSRTPGPTWLGAALAGLGMAAVVLLGSLPRHLVIERRAAAGRAARADTGADRGDELGDILRRARAAGGIDRVRPLLDQVTELDRRAASLPGRDLLTARAIELSRRAESTDDELARGEYQRARAALDQQLAEVDTIATGRERLLARLHRELADIEGQRTQAVSTDVDVASQALIESDPEHAA